MTRPPLPLARAACAAALLATAVAHAQDDEPAATPFRPTVASGAYLSRAGWLEAEVGGQRLGGNGQDQVNSLPYLLKYSVDDVFALLIGGDAVAHSAAPDGSHAGGLGDTSLTLKVRVPHADEHTAFGFELTAKEPTAAKGLGDGGHDYTFKGIVSHDFDSGFHIDANLLATRLGAVDDGQSRLQTAWAAALSHPAGDAWTLAADLSGTRQSGAPSTAQLLGAASYVVTKRWVVDFGVAGGLNDATPKWTVLAGMTVLIGELR